MAASLGELFVELGVFANTKELKDFENKLKRVNTTIKETKTKNDNLTKSVKGFVKGVAGIATAITGALYALQRLTDSLVSQNQEFLNLTRNSDIALGTFQKWNNVGRMFGVKNAAQQLANLNQRLFELKLTGEGADGFILAGINPLGQDAEGVLEQLRNRVAGLDDTTATFLLTRMGLDPTMLHLLRMTRTEFEAFNKETSKYRLTEEQSKQLQMMNTQLEIARIKIQNMKDQALLAIMPYLIRFMNLVAQIIEKVMNLVKWLGSDNEFAKFIRFVLKIIGTFGAWIVTITALAKTFQFLATAITIVRTALLALTAHPIIAAVTALLWLLMKVVEHYSEGGAGRGLYSTRRAERNSIDYAIPKLQQMNQNIDNRKYLSNVRNHNPQITMNNTINTTETAQAVSNELAYYQYSSYGYSY